MISESLSLFWKYLNIISHTLSFAFGRTKHYLQIKIIFTSKRKPEQNQEKKLLPLVPGFFNSKLKLLPLPQLESPQICIRSFGGGTLGTPVNWKPNYAEGTLLPPIVGLATFDPKICKEREEGQFYVTINYPLKSVLKLQNLNKLKLNTRSINLTIFVLCIFKNHMVQLTK